MGVKIKNSELKTVLQIMNVQYKMMEF